MDTLSAYLWGRVWEPILTPEKKVLGRICQPSIFKNWWNWDEGPEWTHFPPICGVGCGNQSSPQKKSWGFHQ
jgi:hypothetical protein